MVPLSQSAGPLPALVAERVPTAPGVFGRSPDMWDRPRTSAGIEVLAEYVTALGIDPDRLLTGTGLEHLHPEARGPRIEAHDEIAVTRNLLSILGATDGVGLDVGLAYHASSYGLYGYLMMSSPNIFQGVLRGMENIGLTYAFSSISAAIDENGDFVQSFDVRHVPADLQTFFAERDLAAAVMLHAEVLGVPRIETLKEIRFASSPPDVSAYERIFEVPVLFGQRRNEVVYDAAFLSLRPPQANPRTHEECRELCRQAIRSLDDVRSTAAAVRSRLLVEGGIDEGLDSAAKALFLAPRTLRRRLAAEGTTYRALVDEVRQRLATDLLHDRSLSAAEIAQRLGYQDTSSFSRALRRWRDGDCDG